MCWEGKIDRFNSGVNLDFSVTLVQLRDIAETWFRTMLLNLNYAPLSLKD